MKPVQPQRPAAKSASRISKSPLRNTRPTKQSATQNMKTRRPPRKESTSLTLSGITSAASSTNYGKLRKDNQQFLQQSHDPKYPHVTDILEVRAKEAFAQRQAGARTADNTYDNDRSWNVTETREPFFVEQPTVKGQTVGSLHRSYNTLRKSNTTAEDLSITSCF